jgi:hypothetical protein
MRDMAEFALGSDPSRAKVTASAMDLHVPRAVDGPPSGARAAIRRATESGGALGGAAQFGRK